jgi:hypothetical protein
MSDKKEGPYEINESASGNQFVWVDGPAVHILVHGRGEAGETRDALNIAYAEGRRTPDARLEAERAVIEAAKKARAGGPYTPMFDALDALAALARTEKKPC